MTPPDLTVRHVMNPQPVVIPPDTNVQQVLEVMNDRRIGSVLVVSHDDKLLGIFTERDLLRRVASATPGWRDQPVAAWMTTNPYTIGLDVGWAEAVEAMERYKVRHLPVIEQGRVVGIVSSRMLMGRRAEYLNRYVEERTFALRQAYEQLLARDAEMLSNLRAAGRLQRKVLLPHAPPEWSEFRWAIHYAPLDYLGGDHYDFATPSVDHLGFLIADASGHSIPAAMVAVMARYAFAEASPSLQVAEVLRTMNLRLQELSEDRFVSAFYSIFDRRTGVVRYSSAGHPPPLLFESRTGQVRQLSAQGFLLGIMPEEIYQEREVALEPGDRLCFYTDGLIEARDEIGRLYGTERLKACLARHADLDSDGLMKQVLHDQRSFSNGVALSDDLTLVILEVRGDG